MITVAGREPRRPIRLIAEAEKSAAPTGVVYSPVSQILEVDDDKRKSWGGADIKAETTTSTATATAIKVSCLDETQSIASSDSSTSSGTPPPPPN